MLVVTIAATNYPAAEQILKKARAYPIDAIELRLDYFHKIDLNALQKLIAGFSGPKIFTFRRKSQGGHFSGNEQQQMGIIKKLATLEPDYFDLEYDSPAKLIELLDTTHPKINLIASYHNFTETPGNLDNLLREISRPQFYGYKIAVQANSVLDTMRMLNFVYKHSKAQKITGICMGELGAATRILAPIVESYFNFAPVDKNTRNAPGQLTIEELLNTYNYKNLNPQTAIYALIGNITQQSKTHILHNRLFKERSVNAVCLTLPLEANEIDEFSSQAKRLPIKLINQ